MVVRRAEIRNSRDTMPQPNLMVVNKKEIYKCKYMYTMYIFEFIIEIFRVTHLRKITTILCSSFQSKPLKKV